MPFQKKMFIFSYKPAIDPFLASG
uniref:Uncharacterized protein n=1 Tax=Lepeophtheirus salmonis TaxID=72036 RepID=A0A0K2UGE6_LEPSM